MAIQDLNKQFTNVITANYDLTSTKLLDKKEAVTKTKALKFNLLRLVLR